MSFRRTHSYSHLYAPIHTTELSSAQVQRGTRLKMFGALKLDE